MFEDYPRIVGPPRPGLKMRELEKAIDKTISAVEFGQQENPPPASAHEAEAIVLHFTDGTALSITVGSNVRPNQRVNPRRCSHGPHAHMEAERHPGMRVQRTARGALHCCAQLTGAIEELEAALEDPKLSRRRQEAEEAARCANGIIVAALPTGRSHE